MFNRFPSEIGHISSLEFKRFEEVLYDEKARLEEASREAERTERLRRM